MAFTLADREVRPLTADEVMRMVELGILSEDERVELLHGVLTEKAVKSTEHEEIKARLNRWLAPGIVAGRYGVRTEGALIVPDRTSLPEPDMVVVQVGDYLRRHPSTAHLAIEVAVSSLKIDTAIKPPLYAAAGVPEYWVVDVAARRLEVLTDPTAAGYGRRETFDRTARVQPVDVDIQPLDLAELFAGL